MNVPAADADLYAEPPASEPQDLGGRARRGVAVLLSRQIAGQLITLVSGIVLAWVLAPADFAVYAICAYLLNLFTVCGNAGMGTALIQQRAEPTQRELAVAFTTQLVLLTLFAAVALVVGPLLISAHPQLSAGSGYGALFCWMTVAMWISAQGWIPMAILERSMNFGALARVELLQQAASQTVVVALALSGWGVWSFAIGSLVGAVVGTLIIFAASGWRPALDWDRSIAWRLAKFGVPMQASWLAGMIGRGSGALVLAPALGATQFGIVLWAERLGTKFQFLANPLHRVTFSHFSRVADEGSLARIYGRYLLAGSLVVGAWVGIVSTLGESVFLPLYGGDKWAAGLSAVRFYALAATAMTLRGFTISLLNAMGRSTNTLAIELLDSVGKITLTFLLVGQFNMKAEALAILAVAATVAITCSARASFRCFKACLKAFATLSVSLLAARGAENIATIALGDSLLACIGAAAAGLVTYAAVLLTLASKEDRSWLLAGIHAMARRVGRTIHAAISPLRKGETATKTLSA